MSAELLDAIREIVREEAGAIASPWMDTSEAAAYLKSTAGTLKNWRATGQGPKYHTVQSKLIRYHRDELDAFVRSGTR